MSKVITFRVDTELAQRIREAARSDGRFRSAFLRRLVAAALDRRTSEEGQS